MVAAYLALGANLGDRIENLKRALTLLVATGEVNIIKISPVYETAAVGGPEQGPFLNACTAVETVLSPTLLLLKMLGIEEIMGRVRSERWGPRVIDLDLLVYSNITMNTPLLELPHPRLAKRDFVLIPLADLAPDLIIQDHSLSVADILAARPAAEDVKLYPPRDWYSKS